MQLFYNYFVSNIKYIIKFKIMKRFILISLSVMYALFGLMSCNNSIESDYKKSLQKQEKITKIANKVSTDGILDNKEVKELNKLFADLNDFIEKSNARNMKKFQTDLNAIKKEAEQLEKYLDENEDKIDKIDEEFWDAIFNLEECEGFDRLKIPSNLSFD